MARIGSIDEDRADLEVLSSNLKKTLSISASMTQLLDGFNERLLKVDESMKPIHRTTQRLKLVERNVDAALAAIQKTKSFWTIPGEEEPIIRAGPKANLGAYLASLCRLDHGLVLLKATGDESSQKIAHKIQQLLDQGVASLQTTCKAILDERGSQIEPLSFIVKNQPLPVYDHEQVAFLSRAARFAQEQRHISGLNGLVYNDFITVRSTFFQKSLLTFVLASKRNLEIRTSNLYDKENNGIGHYTEALSRMSHSEKNLCAIVFGETEGTEIHNKVVSPGFFDYSSACKAIQAHVRSRLSTDCFLGFETLENMLKLSRVVKDIDMPEVARELHQDITNLATISAHAFHELLRDIERMCIALTSLPSDASVVEVTKELCTRLKRFLDYPQIVSQLMQALGDSGWRKGNNNAIRVQGGRSDTGLKLFDRFAAELIQTLVDNLEQKARTLQKKLNIVGIFLLNNASYIHTSIVRSEMARYLSEAAVARLEETNRKAFKMYRESWDISARQLMDTTIMRPQDPKASRNSLTSKDREAVKERFRLFNTEFDESIRACKSFNVIDTDLRQQLTSEIRSIIVPLYSRFHDKYVNTEFTKNKEKYIKYSKEGIEKAIWEAFS